MNTPILVAPAAEVTRRPTDDPPGDPPGGLGPAFGSALAQAGQAPQPKGRADGARTAKAEGADIEAADCGDGKAQFLPGKSLRRGGELDPMAGVLRHDCRGIDSGHL